MTRDNVLKQRWDRLASKLSHQFADGDLLNIDAIIYLIGLQELGQHHRTFKKDDKINLMHIGICRLLEPYGYYEFDYIDKEGWPHFKLKAQLPQLKPGEQTILMKQAIINYFLEVNFIE